MAAMTLINAVKCCAATQWVQEGPANARVSAR